MRSGIASAVNAASSSAVKTFSTLRIRSSTSSGTTLLTFFFFRHALLRHFRQRTKHRRQHHCANKNRQYLFHGSTSVICPARSAAKCLIPCQRPRSGFQFEAAELIPPIPRRAEPCPLNVRAKPTSNSASHTPLYLKNPKSTAIIQDNNMLCKHSGSRLAIPPLHGAGCPKHAFRPASLSPTQSKAPDPHNPCGSGARFIPITSA